ncbi:hypothetical protein BO70DRAFT_32347 [Aspergillus heteromorphus CBS 117.55]|uniref:Uncharacterized protein n=1 Tax=Aspergillus heteromorphus CBS 117.55 TaxID=1448321 RepID=A0A317WAX9_9EURO|nr:uncharacterized protein BO70DRAFT_32347 [Aspergillus heteromorphus CBS 117.55]PWY82941.1 hypothetical protein BO70DRAFT_32347 [Aspergillus heteromorphus CBS 117.55]
MSCTGKTHHHRHHHHLAFDRNESRSHSSCRVFFHFFLYFFHRLSVCLSVGLSALPVSSISSILPRQEVRQADRQYISSRQCRVADGYDTDTDTDTDTDAITIAA